MIFWVIRSDIQFLVQTMINDQGYENTVLQQMLVHHSSNTEILRYL